MKKQNTNERGNEDMNGQEKLDKRFGELRGEGKTVYQACQVLMQEGATLQEAADTANRTSTRPTPPRACKDKYSPYTRKQARYYQDMEQNLYGE